VEANDYEVPEGSELSKNPLALDFIKKCTAVNGSERPDIQQLIDHDYFDDIHHSENMLNNDVEFKRPMDSLF